jgi:hypothetical protein
MLAKYSTDKAVFDHGKVGRSLQAERYDEPGNEQHETDPEVAVTIRASAEGRNEDSLLKDQASFKEDNGRSFKWDPQPPRRPGGAIRCY